MAYDIGPRIGIDGEAEFRKQLNNINTSLRTLGTEMQKVVSEFAENARNRGNSLRHPRKPWQRLRKNMEKMPRRP